MDIVQKARRELKIHFETEVCKSNPVPKDHHPYIGTKLQELEQKTATKISLSKVILTYFQKPLIMNLIDLSVLEQKLLENHEIYYVGAAE